MSAFFYLQPTLNRLFNNCTQLDWHWISSSSLFRIKIFHRFSEHRSSFLEVLYRSSCSLIYAVMKYLNFHSSGSTLDSVTSKITKNWFRHRYFSKSFSTSAEQRYWKCVLMAASENNFILEKLLNCAKTFTLKILMVTHILHF